LPSVARVDSGTKAACGARRNGSSMTLIAPSDADLRTLTAQVMDSDAVEPFGVYMFRSSDPGAELGRHVERTVFLETFGNTAELLAEEYAPYEPSSVFICVFDHLRSLPAGVLRVILPSRAGFKSLNDLEPWWGEKSETVIERTGLAMEPKETWDVATLAVLPDYRGKATMGLVSLGLYQTLTMSAVRSGIDWFVAILDMPAYRMIRWKLRMTFAGYKGVKAMPYLGTPANMPAWCRLSEAKERLSGADPVLHDLLFDGTGIEPAVRPLDLSRADSLVA
jgi:hypothetical protein